ncbi:STAS domain-containing protein [Neptunomonas qingdaonensis]|uniref:Anti-anti-sigma factor n=1 Tax=Neptunomonas qingdaonensis TaxID=1045558 RepID=A0A1I2SQC6_9GAMM|nr:STAS domain-containing protein [Neptunomonas qingdaonensis]SFG54882.1 anti-anti-sigma factor [Neptunomonas qingdaonensis]
MNQGSIHYALLDNHYVIKFTGEVRLTQCSSLGAHIEKVISSDECEHVLVDVTEATCLDSTTLGLIAKLAVRAKNRGLPAPMVVSTHDDVTRTLLSMGFDQIFVFLDVLPLTQYELIQVPLIQESAEQMQQRIIKAHKVLMSLNDSNYEAFNSLIAALEEK